MNAKATRTNYRDADAPTAGLWFGRGKNPSGLGIPVTLEREARAIRIRDAGTGDTVDAFGDTGKFWFAPELEQAPEDFDTAAARALEVETHLSDYLSWSSSGRNSAPGIALLHSTLAVAETKAAQAGDHALAAALTARLAEIQPAYDAHRAEQDAEMVRLKARVAAQRAAEATAVAVPAPAAVEPAPAGPVVIVPCGGKKSPGTLPAGSKYIGSYHLMTRKAATAIAGRTGARVIVLSARYGLLEMGDLVDDYDLTMGDAGAVTAGRVAEQAAQLGITDAAVTVIDGKKYADVVTAVWPHAVRALDGTNGMPHQMKRMSEIVRGEWAPTAVYAAPAAVPALFGADLVAPPTVTLAAAGDLARGDVLAPGTFGETHADPVLVISRARPVDQPGGRRRVTVMIRPLTFPGRGRHLVVWSDAGVDVVGREVCKPGDPPHPPAEEAEILDGPALSWPRLITGDLLRAGDVIAPGGFGPWNRTDTITVTTDPRYLDTVMGARRFDIGYRVNLRAGAGAGPQTHGAVRNDQYVPVLDRPAALEAAPAAQLDPAPTGTYVALPAGCSLAAATDAAAAAALEDVDAAPAVEPVDLVDVVEPTTVEKVQNAQLALIGEPLELTAGPVPAPAAAAPAVPAVRSPLARPDLHTDALPLVVTAPARPP